jgi:hypothetical protein
MKKSLILFLVASTISVLTYSCGSKAKKNDAALKKAEKAVKTDVTDVFNTVITASTGGLGSVIMDMAMSKEKRDSIMYDPIKPIVHGELAKKTDAELKEITDNKTVRVKFIAQCISANQDKISSSASETTQWIGALLEKYNEQAAQ